MPDTKSVWKSRRLWTAIMTAVIDIATVLLQIYVLDPKWQQLIVVLIAAVTSVGAVLIGLFTYEDTVVAKLRAQIAMHTMGIDAELKMSGLKSDDKI